MYEKKTVTEVARTLTARDEMSKGKNYRGSDEENRARTHFECIYYRYILLDRECVIRGQSLYHNVILLTETIEYIYASTHC